ncbi:WxcM-like domain-containing protein [Candidatus Roizmanbacteria bacterium]|nr:WxcM-like domain-containing protein [Candidatus Roizmanbacteria bacterium]
MNYKITQFKKFDDDRGSLIVFLKESELDDAKKRFGQIYFVTFKKKGMIRGNHYHKKWSEWFGIINGRVEVILEDVRTKKRKQIILDAKKNQYMRLETGPYIAHTIKSLTQYASLLSYADAQWSRKDNYYYKLL